MTSKLYKKGKIALLVYIIPISLIILLCSYRLGEHGYPIIYGDEYGYWAAGSYYAGLHWEEITSINPYYGYGYGILLSLILRMCNTPIMAYKIALYINVLFVSIMYVLVLQCERIIIKLSQQEVSRVVQTLMAMIVVCYSSTLQYVHYTMAEIPVYLVTWIGIYAVLKYLEQDSYKNIFILIIISAGFIAIHMRNIGFLLTVLLFVTYTQIRKREYKKIMLIFVIGVISLLVVIGFKKLYTGQYYITISGIQRSEANEMSGIVSKLLIPWKISAVKQIVISICGKLYYMVIATYGIGVISLFISAKAMLKILFNKKMTQYELFLVFSLLYMGSMLLISCIYMNDYSTRFDLFLYGRYFENTIPVLMLLGMLTVVGNKKRIGIEQLFLMLCFVLSISKIAEINQDYSLPKGNVFINMTPVAAVLENNQFQKGTYGILGISVCIVILLLYLLGSGAVNKIYRNVLAIIILGGVLLGEVLSAKYVLDNGFYSWAVKENESEMALVDIIQDRGIEDELYFFPDGYVLSADGVQFLLRDSTIHVTDTLEEDWEYVLTSTKASNENSMEMYGYKTIGESQRLRLWQKKIR